MTDVTLDVQEIEDQAEHYLMGEDLAVVAENYDTDVVSMVAAWVEYGRRLIVEAQLLEDEQHAR